MAAALAFSTLFITACTHSTNTVPAVQTGSPETTVVHPATGGTFVQYALPAGVEPPGAIARGPYSTIWFPSGDGVEPGFSKMCRLLTTNGTFHCYAVPGGQDGFVNGGSPVGAAGAVFWVLVQPSGENTDFLARITPTGTISTFGLGVSDAPFGNLVIGSDAKIWFTTCGNEGDCSFGSLLGSIPTSGVGGQYLFFPQFNGFQITPGPGGNIYVAGTILSPLPPAPPCSPCDAVKVVSTAQSLLHTFPLPDNGFLAGIVTGADHNLWITERDANKIARMTPSGAVRQFNVPTPNAGLGRITYGENSTLWFIENNANKIGRITTTGVITEFPIPSDTSRGGIEPCTTECPPHGGVWFSQTHHIAKFIAP